MVKKSTNFALSLMDILYSSTAELKSTLDLSLSTYQTNQAPPGEVAFPGHSWKPGAFRLRVDPLTLSFRGDFEHLEKHFHQNYFESNLRHLRICHLIAVLFYGLTGLLENILIPEAISALWAVRYGFVMPLFIIGLGFTFTKYYEKCWYSISAGYILATGGGFVMMIILGPKPEIYAYYVGVILSMFFGYTFIRERFVHASLAGCLLLIGGRRCGRTTEYCRQNFDKTGLFRGFLRQRRGGCRIHAEPFDRSGYFRYDHGSGDGRARNLPTDY